MKTLISSSLIAVLSLVMACGNGGGNSDTCARGVAHVTRLITASKPSADEQKVIDAVTKQSLATCHSEGLSKAQLECIMATRDAAEIATLGDCAAIKAKRPSWLLLP